MTTRLRRAAAALFMRPAGLALGVTLACVPRTAHAFSDPLSFADPVELGGGGNRFFTGSVADGFGCDVCHAGGSSPRLTLLGLPLSGYAPATAYEIRVEWPAELEHIGLALEITGPSGAAAGSLRLPPASELPDPERCEPVEDGIAAGVLTELQGRTVLSVPDCGARRVRLLWIAPSEARDALRFSGGLVASDGEADVAGDGVTLFAHVLPPTRSSGIPASDISGGCSVHAPARGRSLLPFAALVLGWTIWLRVRRARSR